MALAECPKCAIHIIRHPDWKEGMVIECPECGAKLVVASLEPLELEEAQE
jgi:lysine biosynthesis protein LysW